MISDQVKISIENGRWIKELFEAGSQLSQIRGVENVFDLSIGNPTFEPPAEFKQAILKLLNSNLSGIHRYTPNAGLPEVRNFFAQNLKSETNLEFSSQHIVMTAGAAGGLNVVLKTLCNPGEEVLFFRPYFPEYFSYAINHGAIAKPVSTSSTFRPNLEELEKHITAQTKMIILNSPNNPTGVIYNSKELTAVAQIIRAKELEYSKKIFICADEPYKEIVFEGHRVPDIFSFHENTISVTSFSKNLAIPGERIGFIAVSPRIKDFSLLVEGLAISNRTLGFVNAPSLLQRVLPEVGRARMDMRPYIENREILLTQLKELGVECQSPQGAFYLFPKLKISDDISFVKEALKEGVVLVPGSGFGAPGYVRICFCFETSKIKASLASIRKIFS